TFAEGAAPKLRVLRNSQFRVWNWASIEGPVADNTCFNESNNPVACVGAAAAGWEVVPASRFSDLIQTHWRKDSSAGNAADSAAMDSQFATYARNSRRCGFEPAANINGSGNRFNGSNSCTNDHYLTQF